MGIELGKYIKALRLEKKYSVKAAAELSNISKSYWDFIERGEREPSFEKLKSISKTLDCAIEDLININSKPIKSSNLTLVKEEKNEYFIDSYKSMTDSKKISLESELNISKQLTEFLYSDGWESSNNIFHINTQQILWDIVFKKENCYWVIDIKIVNTHINNLHNLYNLLGKTLCNISENITRYSIATNNKYFFNYLVKNFPNKLNSLIKISFILVEDNGCITLSFPKFVK